MKITVNTLTLQTVARGVALSRNGKRLRQENDGLKNRVQILEGLLNGQIPPFALERIDACLGSKP